METTKRLELKDENVAPDDGVLKDVLGAGYPAYIALLDLFDNHGLTHEWRYYHDGKAWLCKVQSKKRTIVWMGVRQSVLLATIYFPEKSAELVYELELSPQRKEQIRATGRIGKSRACVFEVVDESVLEEFSQVMLLKLKLK